MSRRPECPGCQRPLRRSLLADVSADHRAACWVRDAEDATLVVDLAVVLVGLPAQRRSLTRAEGALVRALGGQPSAVTVEVARLSRQVRSRRFLGIDLEAVLGPSPLHLGAAARAGAAASSEAA